MDPTLLALLSIFGGALLTVTAGFIGAWIQSRREHEKWLRERRYDSYLSVVQVNNELASEVQSAIELRDRISTIRNEIETLTAKPSGERNDTADEELLRRQVVARATLDEIIVEFKAGRERRDVMLSELIERVSAFQLLGPDDVVQKAAQVLDTDADEDGTAEMNRRSRELEAVMRKALKISY